VKKKSAKIVKNVARPKVDRATAERLVNELANPKRLAQEAEKLLRHLRNDPAMARIRFDADALLAALAQHDTVEQLADALVTDDVRAFARVILEERASQGGKIEEILPYRVGMHLLETEAQAKRPAGKNPFWAAVAYATAHELPVTFYLASRAIAEITAEARDGRVAAAFAAFLVSDPRVAALKKAVHMLDLESILLHAMLAFDEGAEIALPLEATLAGPIEAAKSTRRRQALAGIGMSDPLGAEQAKVLMLAVEKDRDRAIPAYRAELLERFEEAARDADARRLRTIFALLVSLEVLPASRNVPLMGAYEQAAPRAVDEAEGEEKALVHAVLARPMDVAGYRAYAAWLAKTDPARCIGFVAAALAHFPDDAGLGDVLK
jgi:hypothetical protein